MLVGRRLIRKSVGKISQKGQRGTLREKCPYSEIFWSVFSPNAGKYGP